MEIKLECYCGMKYEFEVEPIDGRMPYEISCPNCGNDGTDYANQYLAQTLGAPATPQPILPDSPPATPQPILPDPPPAAPQPVLPSQPTSPPSSTSENEARPKLTLPSQRAAEAEVAPAAPTVEPASPAAGSSGLKIGVRPREETPEAAPEPPTAKPEFENLAAANEDAKRKRMEAIKKKQQAEKDLWRKMSILGGIGALFVLALVALFGWYIFSGSKPREFHVVEAAEQVYPSEARLLAPNRLLLLDANGLTLHDLDTLEQIWQAEVKAADSPSRFAQMEILDGHAWIFRGRSVTRVNLLTGAVDATAEVKGDVSRITASDKSILVSASSTRRNYQALTRIDLQTAKTKTQEIKVEEVARISPDVGGEANFDPTVANLTARELRIGGMTLRKNWDDFVPTGENLAQLTVKMLTPKVTTVSAMRPVGESALNQKAKASIDPTALVDEMVNEIARANGGATKEINESSYTATLKRHFAEGKTETWTGRLKGDIRLFPGRTVDCLTDNESLFIFNKQNKLLKKAKLSFPVHPSYGTGGPRVPFVELEDRLYFFDHGVLTAYDLPSGNAAWRLPTVGITKIEADDDGHLFVRSTTAPPESIQFSEQVYLKNGPRPILIKLDAKTGKKLWETDKAGQHSWLAGDYMYATFRSTGALGGLTGAVSDKFTLYRIDPGDGDRIFEKVIEGGGAIDFNGTCILVKENNRYRVFKYLSLF